jgi:predicted DsbA family dithiol-disulfide isomerase
MACVTYYLEVLSSWCYWAEPAWIELKQRFSGRAEFNWKIALMPPEAFPASKNQCEWFYRRSGSIVRSPFMLNSGWFEPERKEYSAPNFLAEAARDLGVADDRVRLALSHAAVREGKQIGRWEVALPVASEAGGIESEKLLKRARSKEIEQRCRKTTEEFHSLQVNQRPTFLIENEIGDRAVFSGIVRVDPLSSAVEALLADEAAYASWAAHFGPPPAK